MKLSVLIMRVHFILTILFYVAIIKAVLYCKNCVCKYIEIFKQSISLLHFHLKFLVYGKEEILGGFCTTEFNCIIIAIYLGKPAKISSITRHSEIGKEGWLKI